MCHEWPIPSPHKRVYFDLLLFTDEDLLDLPDFLVHLTDPALPSSACTLPSHGSPPTPSTAMVARFRSRWRLRVSRHIPKEEMIRAPRAANVNATDFFAWMFWGTPVAGCGGRPSNQSKSPASISKASSCASITALRQSALLSLIFGPSLSSRNFFWSAMGLLSRN